MKASPATELPTDADLWMVEPKYDGWRGTFTKRSSGGALASATGKPIKLPYITNVLTHVPDNTILDGEIVNLNGGDQWNLTQSICSRDAVHVPSAQEPALTYMVFDVLRLMDKPLEAKPLSERKELLRTLFSLMDESPYVQTVDEHPLTEHAVALLIEEGFEGVVAKRRDSQYVAGSRGPAWLKIKPETEIEVTITGMYAAEAGSKFEHSAVGGFEFHVEHADGKSYDGRCGTGMTNALREEMHQDPNRFIGKVAELKHWGIGDTGALRFPSLKRIRDEADKAVAEVTPTVDEPAPEPPATVNANEQHILVQLLDVTRERDLYKAKAEDLQTRLDATLSGAANIRAAVSPNQRQGKRNFKRMGAAKLTDALRDLRAGHGEHYQDAIERGEAPDEALSRAKEAAALMGLSV